MRKFIIEQSKEDMRKLLKTNRIIYLIFKQAFTALKENSKYSITEILFGIKKQEEEPSSLKRKQQRYRVVATEDVNIHINNWFNHIYNTKNTL